MREITKFKGLKPAGAEGRVCIDLKDPDTMKVKERIKGINHVFEESLMSVVTSLSNNTWIDAISRAYLCLNSTNKTIDPHIPYLFGQTVGYGRANQAGTGLFRGAYNSANQILAQQLLDSSIFWRFQYDFTTAQANDIPISLVGLTNQYELVRKTMLLGFKGTTSPSGTYTGDGRYAYSCTSDGVITKTDLYTGQQVLIDVSNDVGITDNKSIGYSPKNKRYYVCVHANNSGASRRKLYEYSDSSFNNLLSSYDIPSNTFNNIAALYIYDNIAYFFYSYDSIFAINYISGEAPYTINIPVIGNNAIITEGGQSYNDRLATISGTCPLSSRYIKCGGDTTNYNKCIIFDLLTEEVVAYMSNTHVSRVGYIYPIIEEQIICHGNTASFVNALTAYKLSTPFTKTSANAMTVTYELEVFW